MKTATKKNQIKRLLLIQNQCHICGKGFAAENIPSRDHIVPASQGGKNCIANIRLAHELCNHKRSSENIQMYKMRMLLLERFPFLEEKTYYVVKGELKLKGVFKRR